jgi:hypothetical protein
MSANLDGLTVVSIDGKVKHPSRLVGAAREEFRTICRPAKVQYGALMRVHGFSLALSLGSYLINAHLSESDASARQFTV